ncbi:MAG: hypothetical protein EBE86_014185 [Hormoscilla sp. GUM202]|nr:hypothetical protein [Hormoscilla sp. GUM202]
MPRSFDVTGARGTIIIALNWRSGLSNILGFVCRLLTVQFHSYSESLAIGGWTGATVLVEFCGDPDRRNPVSGHKHAIATPGYITFVSLFNLGS